MATIAGRRAGIDRDVRFFLISAIVMAIVLVAGFSLQFAMGRSTFAAPWPVHLHALLFFGWVALYVTQNVLAGSPAAVATHKRLGWIAMIWAPAMVVVGCTTTIAMVRRGAVPFFFEPLFFLILDPMTVIAFGGFVAAGMILRRRTQWHRRMMFCGMAMLLGPGFGRLLPMPFLIPWAGWAAFLPVMLFPAAGVIRDLRLSGRVHPGWWWGAAAMLGTQISIELIAASPVGLAIYDLVTQGSPGAQIAPRAYPPFPPGM